MINSVISVVVWVWDRVYVLLSRVFIFKKHMPHNRTFIIVSSCWRVGDGQLIVSMCELALISESALSCLKQLALLNVGVVAFRRSSASDLAEFRVGVLPRRLLVSWA